MHRHFLASISPGGWRVWLHLLYEPRNLGLYQEETLLFTFTLIFMNLKYLVVFFFSGIAEWAEFQNTITKLLWWELIKRHVKPKQKNKTCPPIQVNLCYFICCMVKFTCNLNSMYTELNPVYLACILIQQAWNITDSMIY